MRVLYFDCFAGVSGDMIVGALIDLGVDLETLKRQLASLELEGYAINISRATRGGISAAKFDVEVEQEDQSEKPFAKIRSLLLASDLTETAKRRSLAAFERLATVEARIHGTSPDKVHFHEVGAVDSIVDIAGAMVGFELLGVDRFFCSPLRVGSGLVDSRHGPLPVPAPATAELLRGVPVYAGEIEGEFVTPTGAAIVATLCGEFGPLPPMSIAKVGYGAGSRDPAGFSNALRLVLGEMQEADAARRSELRKGSDESVLVLETNIDDMNPQACGFVMSRALALGALDVWVMPAQMKKDRPGVLLTVLCRQSALEPLLDMLLAETTTLGVRYYEAKRRVLERTIETVETNYGSVRVKVARDGERTLHFQPEYEDCARLAIEQGVPLLEVQGAASAAYRNRMSGADGKLKEKQRA